MKNRKLGIIGCGTIGSEIAIAISRGQIDGYVLSGLCDIDDSKAHRLKSQLVYEADALEFEPLLEVSDVVFEATTKSAMPAIARSVLEAGKVILAMSVGGVVDAQELLESTDERRGRLFLPSGAICGVDGILAAREAGLKRVRIKSTKNPRSLRGAPYLEKHGISVDDLSEPQTVFEGSAREAIEAFPANANVSVTLSIAAGDIDRTEVCVVADPNCKMTKHEIIAEGDFGSVRAITEGTVAPGNPRTGYLAILSAKAALRKIANHVRPGT